MTEPTLRDALADLADDAPRSTGVDLAAGLWERATRQRTRDTRQLVAAVVTLIAMVGTFSLTWHSLSAPTPASSQGAEPGLPRTLWTPPLHIDQMWIGDSRVETDLAIGPASIATATSMGVPLVVSATDGRQHLLRLPALSHDIARQSAPPALSPDGTRLAWLQVRGGSQTEQVDTAVGVLDLTTGAVRSFPVEGRHGRPLRVERFSYSPDGARLAWLGDEANWWTQGGNTFSGPFRQVGTIDLTDDTMDFWTVRTGGRVTTLAQRDTGDPVVVSGRRLWDFAIGTKARRLLGVDFDSSSAVVSPDGATLVLGVNTQETAGNESGLATLALDRPAAKIDLRSGWGGLPSGARSAPLGFTPAGEVVISTQRGGIMGDPSPLQIMVGPLRESPTRVLTTFSGTTLVPVSVATELAVHPSREFEKPNWPMSDEQKAWLAVLGALCLTAVGWLGLTLRQRRRHLG